MTDIQDIKDTDVSIYSLPLPHLDEWTLDSFEEGGDKHKHLLVHVLGRWSLQFDLY